MGAPRGVIPVKLIAGLISGQTDKFSLSKKILQKKFGPVDNETGIMEFECTRYYEKEFGKKLKRKFLSFRKLIKPHNQFNIKLYTNRVEQKLAFGRKRTINIDPGYVTLSKLVLFTTKDRSHRICIGGGIYADLELCFVDGSFRPLEWTYPDYRTTEYINFFNSVRENYRSQLKSL